jgi:hypothetical protein
MDSFGMLATIVRSRAGLPLGPRWSGEATGAVTEGRNK